MTSIADLSALGILHQIPHCPECDPIKRAALVTALHDSGFRVPPESVRRYVAYGDGPTWVWTTTRSRAELLFDAHEEFVGYELAEIESGAALVIASAGAASVLLEGVTA